MTFQPDLLDHLCKHKADFVGVNYSHKSRKTTGMVLGMDGLFLKEASGAHEALRTGFGVMLVDLKIPKTIQPPHFAMPWSTHHQKVIGEDYFFCDRVMKAGGKMIVDLDLRIGHIGDYEYTLGDPCFKNVTDAKTV